ncbi:MAG: hypothetical protein LQ337_004115 [Flavoplaca oasis]|nr:MAG: hypothetical protein LQ337_004115 [Flavoplaca oasis]
MSTSITIPNEYGYVLLTAYLSTLVGYWHLPNTGRFRKAAKVPYPNAYATPEQVKESKAHYLFNCAQRSHATFLEHQPQFLTTLLISGLKFPLFSSAMGVLWCTGRVIYAKGYTDPNQENGKGRMTGTKIFYIGTLGLLGSAFLSAVSFTGLGDRVMELVK